MHVNSDNDERARVKAEQSLRSAQLQVSTTDGSKDNPTDVAHRTNAGEFSRCILHLFSGPENRKDGLAAELRARGWQCEEYDIVNGSHQNIADDHVWQQILRNIKTGKYQALMAGPPCNTFTPTPGRNKIVDPSR